jgi:hypothetical protein
VSTPASQIEEEIRQGTFLKNLSFEAADKALALKDDEKKDIDSKEKYYNEDHYQDGEGWIGARPDTNSPDIEQIFDLLKRGFVSKNCVAEVTDREKDAVIGHQPNWIVTVRRPLKKIPKQIPDPAFVPDPANPTAEPPMIDDPAGATVDEPLKADEQQRVDELNALLIEWWDTHEALTALQTATVRKLLHGRGYLRLFIPPIKRKNGVVPTAKDLREAGKLIFLETPEVVDAQIISDPLSMDRVGLSRFMVGDDKPVIEAVGLDENNQTVIRIIPRDETLIKGGESTPLSLGERLTLYEMKGKRLVTKQIISQQKLLNLALTMCGYNLTESGFAEDTVTNAELEYDTVSDLTAAGGKRQIPKALPRGPGAVRNFVGLQFVDRDGKLQILTPGVHHREPVPVDTFTNSKALANRTILEEAHQIHADIAGDAAVSGESRITALADFVIHCLDTKTSVDAAGTWLLETVGAYSAQLSGQKDRYIDLRINFDCKIDTGRLSPDERTALISEVDKKLRSRKSYMLITGQTDPEAELSQILSESRQLQKLMPAPTPPPAPGNNPPGNQPPAPPAGQ